MIDNGSLGRCVRALIRKHDGVRKCARALQVDAAYLSRLANGEKLNPSTPTEKKLGLERVTYWRLRK